MRRAPATAVALTTLALALAACMLDRRGNPNPDSGVTNSSGAAVSTGAGGASSSSGKGGSGGTGQGGKGAGGLGAGGSGGGMGIPSLDCSSPDLWACYDFDGDTMDQAGTYHFEGDSPMFVALPVGKAFDVSLSGAHGTVDKDPVSHHGPNEVAQELTIEMCFYAMSLPTTDDSGVALYRRENWALVYIWKDGSNMPRAGVEIGMQSNSDSYEHSGDIALNAWYYFAAVFDDGSNEATIYLGMSPGDVHSTEDTTYITKTNADDATTLGHPGFDGGPAKFDGYIDNLRVFHSLRTEAEIMVAAANCPQ